MLAVADGSDFMGSLRNPAGWNNAYGRRPSQAACRTGRWSTLRVPVAAPVGRWRNVLDLARLLDVQAAATIPASRCRSTAVADLPMPLPAATPDDARSYRLAGRPDGHRDGRRRARDFARRRCVAEGLGAAVEPVLSPFDATRIWEAWLVWRRWIVAGVSRRFCAPEQRAGQARSSVEVDQAGRTPTATKLCVRASCARCSISRCSTCLKLRRACAADRAGVAVSRRSAGRTRSPCRAMDTYHRWMEVTIYATFAGLPCIAVPAGLASKACRWGCS